MNSIGSILSKIFLNITVGSPFYVTPARNILFKSYNEAIEQLRRIIFSYSYY